MLSAGSFSSPYEHLSQPETKRMVEHYTAYLSDNTRLIANPGLKVHIHTAQCQPEPEVTHKHVLSYTSLSPEWQRTRHYRNQAWRYTNAHYKKKKKTGEMDWKKVRVKFFGTVFVFLHDSWNAVAFYDLQLFPNTKAWWDTPQPPPGRKKNTHPAAWIGHRRSPVYARTRIHTRNLLNRCVPRILATAKVPSFGRAHNLIIHSIAAVWFRQCYKYNPAFLNVCRSNKND